MHAYYDIAGMHDTVGALPGPQSSCLAVTVIVIIFIAVIICSQFDSSALNMARAAHSKAKATKYYPVISVVTLTVTGLLCYAGHVCNYYQKVFEWFRELPAALRDKKWFLIKRRRSVQASPSDTRLKKPTTANRRRLEAGIAEAQRRMPNVYRESVVLPEELAKFPLDEEREMLDSQERVDLDGE